MRSKRGKINVGIAGLGRSGWGIHCRLLEPLAAKYRIAAVFDHDPQRMKEAADRFGCCTHDSYSELIRDEQVELVIVATPNSFHAQNSIDALRAGKHVVSEKPMAASLKDANRMIKAAQKSGAVLTVFQNRRYEPRFLAVKKVIDSGVLGRIVQIKLTAHSFGRRWDWQTLKKNNGGILNNHGPHLIDQALVLFGETQPRVFCLRDQALTLGDADDHAKVVLHAKGRPTIEVEMSRACFYKQAPFLVMGTQGGLTADGKDLRWSYFNPKTLPKRRVDETPTKNRSYNSEKLRFMERVWEADKDRTRGETQFYLDLYQALRRGASLAITPDSVRRQMRVLDQCRRQAPV